MLPSEIEKAIELIDSKIDDLKQAKKTLLEAFGEKTITPQKSSSMVRTNPPKPQLKRISRKDAVIKLIKKEGPLSRSQIIEKSGIPEGTVSYLLNDKTTFIGDNGRWNLVEIVHKEKEEIEKENETKLGLN